MTKQMRKIQKLFGLLEHHKALISAYRIAKDPKEARHITAYNHIKGLLKGEMIW